MIIRERERFMNTGAGYQCATCNVWVFPGVAHYCQGMPMSVPGAVPTPGCRAPWVPLTPDAVRLIVREELERVMQQLGKT